MATILDTLITRLGFETDESGLKKADKGLKDFKATAIKIAGAVGSILAGGFFLKSIAIAADETLKWADANGIVIETLGELEFAAQRQGGSIEGLRSSLDNINKAIGELERGTGAAKESFEAFGLSVKKSNGETKTADELFIDLNRKFKELTKAQQFELATKLGIDVSTIRLLQTAPDEIARLRQEAAKLGVLSRRDAVKAAEFVDGMTNIAQAIQAIKFEIGGLVFAPLTKMFNVIADSIAFVRKHMQVFKILIGLLGLVAAAYFRMGIKAAISWLLALGPVIAIPALIAIAAAAIAVLADDLIAFFKGQSSYIGELVEKWPALGDAIYNIRDVVLILWDALVDLFKMSIEGWKMIGKALYEFFTNPIENTKELLKNLKQIFLNILKTVFDELKKVGDSISEFLLNPIDSIIEKLKQIPGLLKIPQKIAHKISTGITEIINPEAQLQPAPVGVIPQTSLSAFKSANTGKRVNNIKVGSVNVDARGGDSKEIARNVGEALSNQLKNTVEDFDSSIKE